jgi:putative membrane protein
MLLEGRAHEAFILTLYGSILAIPIILLFTPIFILYLPLLFEIIKSFIPFVLIFLSLFIILRDEDFFLGLIIFLLSGLLGLLTFSLPVQQPLLPLLSGLFGLSSLLFSLKGKPKIQKQNLYALTQVKLTKREFSRSLFSSSLFAPLCSFLPGIGSGHAATLSSEFTEQNPRQFLFSLGIINTVIMGLSYVTVYSISKARTGTAASVQQILTKITSLDLSIILLSIIVSGIIAFIIALAVSRFFVLFLNKINYKYLTWAIIGILILVNIFLSNWLGLLVLATSTCLGFFTISSSSRRINLMACLILPSISYYLF